VKILFSWLVCCGFLCSCACSSGDSDASHGSEDLSQVFVNIFGFGDARVGALLIDREGRRTGWNVVGLYREIPGCWHGYGSDEGIPDEAAPEDTTEETPVDTVAGGLESAPMYHYFTILGSVYYTMPDSGATVPPKLLDEGGCELRLDPLTPGRVTLAITGSGTIESGIGRGACQDTTSVMVEPGVPSRWWLSWQAAGGKCIVSISKLKREANRSGIKGN
jgi:hypothetical protein